MKYSAQYQNGTTAEFETLQEAMDDLQVAADGWCEDGWGATYEKQNGESPCGYVLEDGEIIKGIYVTRIDEDEENATQGFSSDLLSSGHMTGVQDV